MGLKSAGGRSAFLKRPGRFSATTSAQVATQVLRTIEYERDPQPAADWYHKGMGIASNQGTGDDGEYDNDDADWYEYKMRLMRFLGIRTFTKDMLARLD